MSKHPHAGLRRGWTGWHPAVSAHCNPLRVDRGCQWIVFQGSYRFLQLVRGNRNPTPSAMAGFFSECLAIRRATSAHSWQNPLLVHPWFSLLLHCFSLQCLLIQLRGLLNIRAESIPWRTRSKLVVYGSQSLTIKKPTKITLSLKVSLVRLSMLL